MCILKVMEHVYYSTPYRDISVSGNYSISPAFFELYINSANNEKIILSSGYVGGVRS